MPLSPTELRSKTVTRVGVPSSRTPSHSLIERSADQLSVPFPASLSRMDSNTLQSASSALWGAPSNVIVLVAHVSTGFGGSVIDGAVPSHATIKATIRTATEPIIVFREFQRSTPRPVVRSRPPVVEVSRYGGY